MSCENCDRANVVKAYCYYVHRQGQFLLLTNTSFTLESFVIYAMEMNLVWKYGVSCTGMTRAEAREYWELLEPFLLKSFKEK